MKIAKLFSWFEMVEIYRNVSITLTNNTKCYIFHIFVSFCVWQTKVIFSIVRYYAKLQMLLHSMHRFYECRLPGKVKFLNCKWSSYNCTQKKRKKEPRWNFFFFFSNSSFVKNLGERNQCNFYMFCIFVPSYIYLLSYHDTQLKGILSKTCEHIFMLIALYEYYILLLASVCFGHNKVFDFIRTQCNHTSLRLTPISLRNIFICPFNTMKGVFFFKIKDSFDIIFLVISNKQWVSLVW